MLKNEHGTFWESNKSKKEKARRGNRVKKNSIKESE
jgi:hypothetical protein